VCTDCLQIHTRRTTRFQTCHRTCFTRVAHLTHLQKPKNFVLTAHSCVLTFRTAVTPLPPVGLPANYARLRHPNHTHLRLGGGRVGPTLCITTPTRNSRLHSNVANSIPTFCSRTSTYCYTQSRETNTRVVFKTYHAHVKPTTRNTNCPSTEQHRSATHSQPSGHTHTHVRRHTCAGTSAGYEPRVFRHCA
jgi:hypothetical protein